LREEDHGKEVLAEENLDEEVLVLEDPIDEAQEPTAKTTERIIIKKRSRLFSMFSMQGLKEKVNGIKLSLRKPPKKKVKKVVKKVVKKG